MQRQYFRYNPETGFFIEAFIAEEREGMPPGVTPIQPPHARGDITMLRFDGTAWHDEGEAYVPGPPTAEAQIAALEYKIHRDMPGVVAHLYDIVTAMVKCVPGMTADEFTLAQANDEPNATGKSRWRRWVAERDALAASLVTMALTIDMPS